MQDSDTGSNTVRTRDIGTAQERGTKSKRPPFQLHTESIAPGTRASIELEAAKLYTHAPLHIPVEVIHGRQEGPTLLVSAAIHGDELNGVEVIRRLLQNSNLKRLRGTLVAVPIVNVFGFIHKSRYLPDRRDLNRCFPGSEKGSLGGRMANLFCQQIFNQCSHAIDLHTGAIHRSNLPQIRCNLDNPGAEQMARAFGVPVILNSPIQNGTLRGYGESQNIPVITYEAGEALRFDESSISAGVRGVLNAMRALGMLRSQAVRRTRLVKEPVVARSSQWARAEQNGVFRPTSGLGDRVRKGDELGMISDPFGMSEITVEAPFSGIVVGRNNLPLVNEGEALFHIARFEEIASAAEKVEAFQTGILDEDPWNPGSPIV